MPTGIIQFADSAWYVLYNGATKMANGTGTRLQLGYVVNGADTWQCRVGLQVDLTGIIPNGAVITAAKVTLHVRGTQSCATKGSTNKISVERTSSANYASDISNTQGTECTFSTNGTIDQNRWGGPPTTSVNRAIYEGNPSVGADIDIDILALFQAWWAAQSDKKLTLVLKACDASGAPDETTAARKIAFDSVYAGTPPLITISYTTNTAPLAPTAGFYPVVGQRMAGTTNREFHANFTDPDDVPPPSSVHIIVATSNTVDGNGKLTTGIVHDLDSAAGITMISPTNIWNVTRTFTQTRGTTYYWQAAVSDPDAAKSAWSAVKNYVVNRLPVPVKVRPT